ncbi:Lrp/AsnC family transcriptional regulator [Pseudomonas sp. GZD-222]|uniref:Lrp/AsnC family transcriptional regulator n=1 Tax=Pseudomonas sp. GZD-222 TaxID=3404805 RepID=UPI003BB5E431
MSETLSPFDLSILANLQTDPRMSMTTLAERMNSSVSPCWRRVKRMEEQGIIRGYTLQLDRKALGLGIEAFVFVNITSHLEKDAAEFEASLHSIDEILECYILSGNEDYLLKIVAADLDAFASFSRKVLAALPHVEEVRSAFVMHKIKQSNRLPLPRS